MSFRSVLLLLALACCLPGCARVENTVFDAFLAAERTLSGLEKTTVVVDDVAWVYLKNDWQPERETVVLLHGFSGDKYNFSRFAGEIAGRYNVLVPDLPGHGETTEDMTLHYDIDTQSRRVLSLTETLGIKQFHLAGNSMGGAIAVRTAWLAPSRVKTLGLFNAGGVRAVESEFDVSLRKGVNPLVIRNAEDFPKVIEWAMAEPPFMPWPVASVMARRSVARADINDKIFGDLQRDNSLDQSRILGEVVAPALVLWGDRDRLLNVGNADAFVKAMPAATRVVMQGIGHMPMLEAPAESAQIYVNFLAAQQ
jgi:abhydrolase domain-containing protein 6